MGDPHALPYRVMNATYKYLYVGRDPILAMSIFREMSLGAEAYQGFTGEEPSVVALDTSGAVIGSIYGATVDEWNRFAGGN